MNFLFVLGFITLFICCTNKDNITANKTENEIIHIAAIELIDKLNTNEQQNIEKYKNCRIQVTGTIASADKPLGRPIINDEIKYFPKSIVTFGDEEWGWEIFFYFDVIVVDDLTVGDNITIKGRLELFKWVRVVIPESVHVPQIGELQYRDVMYVDFKDCVIIDDS